MLINTKDLSEIAIVITMKLLNTAGKQITTLAGIESIGIEFRGIAIDEITII